MKDSWFENFSEEHLKNMEKNNLATTHKQLKKDRRYGKAPIEEDILSQAILSRSKRR
jgi:hypothetical protein